MTNWPEKILLIGCGNMSGAILARWLELGLPPERVTVIRPSGAAVADGVAVHTQLEGAVAPGTLVMLGMKPQQLASVASEASALLGEGVTLVSILAGVPIKRLREAFPATGNIIRCMPNLPVRIGKGVCILKSEGQGDHTLTSELFGGLGLVEWLDDEQLFDAATALAGCGPAFVYRFIDALSVAGAHLGLDPAGSARMALMTVEGAAISASNCAQSPHAMADAVASKGGMTREGLDILDRPDGLLALLSETLKAASDRGAVLAALSNKAG
jgi:pyrroline-5-carboxylate reductase